LFDVPCDPVREMISTRPDTDQNEVIRTRIPLDDLVCDAQQSALHLLLIQHFNNFYSQTSSSLIVWEYIQKSSRVVSREVLTVSFIL
jgi:hypothetical protein